MVNNLQSVWGGDKVLVKVLVVLLSLCLLFPPHFQPFPSQLLPPQNDPANGQRFGQGWLVL